MRSKSVVAIILPRALHFDAQSLLATAGAGIPHACNMAVLRRINRIKK
jgi:hypothetical protein